MVSKTNKEFPIFLLLKNKTLMIILTGGVISNVGDAFFNLAVMWVIYEQSQSVLQTALIGVIWHISGALFSPIAGALTDIVDRKKLLVSIHISSGLVTLFCATYVLINGYLPLWLAFTSVFILNALSIFSSPIQSSLLPDLVSNKHLLSVAGILSTITGLSALLGNMLAGSVIAYVGSGWALSIDSITFFIVAFCISIAKIPKVQKAQSIQETANKISLFTSIVQGWEYIREFNMLKSIVLLLLLLNLASFIGPLYPALVNDQLNGGPSIFGIMQGVSLLGGIVGGIVIGGIGKKFRPGYITLLGWFIAGLCTAFIGISSTIVLTMFLLFLRTFCITISSVSLYTLRMSLVSSQYRGRVDGLLQTFATIAIPISTISAGWFGDFIGVQILFIISGVWIILVSFLGFLLPYFREAQIPDTESSISASN
ncbi:MFS transporter [Cytobacillus sp. IB215665]|uniref:MFS transporter n=1 Tax=Cytobacillus sp. IB215665 TaxID=3097357 RepID=UPI002A133113|nr:MFS transporter [Cytobacillus sp. IB215665]MDX8367659.1 MFS transporter [Cytobacillus sp. IB215665]